MRLSPRFFQTIGVGLVLLFVVLAGGATAQSFGWEKVDIPCPAVGIAASNGRIVVLCSDHQTVYVKR